MHCNSNRQVAIFDRYTHFPCQTHERQYIFLKLKWKPFNRYNGHNDFHFALLMQQRRREALARLAMRQKKKKKNTKARKQLKSYHCCRLKAWSWNPKATEISYSQKFNST